MKRIHRPWLTLGTIALVASTTGLQFVVPSVLDALRRDPVGLANGQWWRLLSPLLVHADGAVAWIANSIGLLIVGAAAEARLGRTRWLLLFLAGGLAGNIAGYAWEPHGAGTSVGVFGLAGGLFVPLLMDEVLPTILLVYLAYIVPALLGAALDDTTILPVVAFVCAGLVLPACRFGLTWVGRVVGLLMLGGAVGLTLLHDNHGPALLVGVLLGWLFWQYRQSSAR